MAWPFDSEADTDALVDEYIDAHREPATTPAAREAASAASMPTMCPTEDEAEAVWRFILKVVAKRPNDWTLGMLAAGPLEDLIGGYGPAFIERMETEARRDAVFRWTLHGVWPSSTRADLWARIERARGPSAVPFR